MVTKRTAQWYSPTAKWSCATVFTVANAIAPYRGCNLRSVVSGTWVSGKPPNGVPGHFPLSDGEEPPAKWSLRQAQKHRSSKSSLLEIAFRISLYSTGFSRISCRNIRVFPVYHHADIRVFPVYPVNQHLNIRVFPVYYESNKTSLSALHPTVDRRPAHYESHIQQH